MRGLFILPGGKGGGSAGFGGLTSSSITSATVSGLMMDCAPHPALSTASSGTSSIPSCRKTIGAGSRFWGFGLGVPGRRASGASFQDSDNFSVVFL